MINGSSRASGFSLIELVIVVVIIGAIAIPRLGYGARSAQWSATTADSNSRGDRFATAADPSQGIIYGPYIREIPPLPPGPNEGNTGIGTWNNPGVGWIYVESSGTIFPNFLDDSDKIPQDILDDLDTSMKELKDWAESAGLIQWLAD